MVAPEDPFGNTLIQMPDNDGGFIFQGTGQEFLDAFGLVMPGPELPPIGEIERSPFDVQLKDLDINWALTQYARDAQREYWNLKYLSDLPELPVYDFSSLEGDPYLDSIEGVDWSITNYAGSEESLNTIKVSQIQDVVIDPVIKDLPGVKGTEFEDDPLITGIGPVNEAQVAAREAELGRPLTDIEKSEFRATSIPLKFSQVSKITSASATATTNSILEAIKGFDDEEQKIVAQNLFMNIPGAYESWEDVLNEDGTVNDDTFTQAVITGYNQAIQAAEVGLAERYLDFFQVDGIEEMEAKEIEEAFKNKVAELEASGGEKQVTYTDLALVQKTIDSAVQTTLGRGATDEEMRVFTEMYQKLEREAVPSTRQRGEAYELMQPNLSAQALQFAETTSPAEAEASKIANASTRMIQALGIGRR
tara:strand:+ start:3397 stop:4656 length:1260 start_codon:yes stop_codon:yes gene_type:complete